MFIIWCIGIGIVTGWAMGRLMTATGGRAATDLVAGAVGAISAGIILRALGVFGPADLLQVVVAAVAGAMFLTFVARLVLWPRQVGS
jgi:uncharacterized membrane protein YeaQ/YmgE (transglycosylase-associated protein family)